MIEAHIHEVLSNQTDRLAQVSHRVELDTNKCIFEMRIPGYPGILISKLHYGTIGLLHICIVKFMIGSLTGRITLFYVTVA